MRYDSDNIRRLMNLTKELQGKLKDGLELDALRSLIEVLTFHEYRYYVDNAPLISDLEYDLLYKSLEAIEKKFPEAISPDSPTQRVGSDLTEEFPSVPHLTPMLSLDNSYNEEDLRDFDKQVRKLTGKGAEEQISYAVEPKFDGGTIVLVYENDRLIRGATRGNGVQGEEITNNTRAIRSIPVFAGFSSKGIHKVELRGEAIIRKSSFLTINEKRQMEGKPLFANPRNAATGGLRVKDHKEIAARGLEAFVYQISSAQDVNGQDLSDQFNGQDDMIAYLGTLGFKVPGTERKLCNNIAEVAAFCRSWEEKRDAYDYEIDGMVVKVNDLKLQELCGSTSHHPRWAIAYKFKAKQAISKLIHIDYQVGKTGAITPVAKIDPVPLAGVTVSSVSLHNEDFILSKDIRIGDMVLVERAGDVIPYIVKSLVERRNGTESPIEFPKQCPSCTNRLVRSEGEAAWRCDNVACPEQVLQKMIHHVSKDGMDIDGLGKSQIEKFVALGWIKDIADIYKLEYDSIAQLEGFGIKSAENLKKSIDQAKGNPLHKLLQSLSIHHLGKKASKIIAGKVHHLMELRDWNLEDYTSINEIGPVLGNNMIDFFNNLEHIALLEKLESLGVNFSQTEEDQAPTSSGEGPLVGKTILFTGTLTTMSRTEAQKLAANAGAKNISAVSANLDILVAGEKAGSKLKKASALGSVNILTESEFLEILSVKNS